MQVIQNKIQWFIGLVSGILDKGGWIHSGSSWSSVVQILLHILSEVMTILTMCQPLVHTVIAVNRLTAFAFPLRHSTIWNRRSVTATILGMATLAVLLDGVPYLYFGIASALEPPSAHGGPSGGQHLPWHFYGVGFLVVLLSYHVFVVLHRTQVVDDRSTATPWHSNDDSL